MAFTRQTSPSDRLVVAVWGMPKTGKTHFSLTFPPPVRFLNFNFGVRELLGKFPDKDIEVSDLPIENARDYATSSALLATFHEDYIGAVKECARDGGTVVVDTMGELYDLVQTVKLHEVRARRSRTGKAEDARPMQFDWGEVNSYMASIVQRPLHEEKLNAVFVHHARQAYSSDGQPTGQLQMQGFGKTPAITQITMQMIAPGEGKIDVCRFDHTLAGAEIEDVDYELLKARVGL